MPSLCRTLFLSFLAVVWAACPRFPSSPASQTAARSPVRKSNSSVAITHADFHGWSAIVLRNGTAQVVVVPAIGRVMQFNLFDHTGNPLPGPFWNNPEIGSQIQSDSEGWTNYGGDKAWPAPQAAWPRIAGRAWPPPKGFDAVPFAATVKGSQVELVSPIDPSYGMRVRRVISLDPRRPIMNIETTYQKVAGAPVHVGIWTVTQLASPDLACILLPPHPALAQGYTNLLTRQPRDLKIDGRLLSLARDPGNNTMIGSEGNALLWVGGDSDLLIENKTSLSVTTGAEWPEHGSHSKIYTNAGEQLQYVELELLDRLRDLSRGETASATSVYTLIPRTQSDPLAEAKKAFERHGGSKTLEPK